jgi:hypothetical protein
MTNDRITVSRELLRQVLCHIDTGSPEWDIGVLIDTLRAALEQPGVEPEIHDAKCPALDGGACGCAESRSFIDKPWARFCGAFGRGPDAPYPGMIEAFEAHYSQSFTDREWHNETAVWAAAWKKAKAHQSPQPQQPAVETVAWLPLDTAPKDGTPICLLVNFDDHATEDGPGPHPTIGSNTSENDQGPDEWQFAGWNWEHDHYTQGVGTPVGWLPMAAQQPAPPADVPLLSDEEIGALVREASKGGALNRDGSTSQRIARAIEQAVRRNAGLK